MTSGVGGMILQPFVMLRLAPMRTSPLGDTRIQYSGICKVINVKTNMEFNESAQKYAKSVGFTFRYFSKRLFAPGKSDAVIRTTKLRSHSELFLLYAQRCA